MSVYDLVKKELQVTGKIKIRKAKILAADEARKTILTSIGLFGLGFWIYYPMITIHWAVWMKTFVFDLKKRYQMLRSGQQILPCF